MGEAKRRKLAAQRSRLVSSSPGLAPSGAIAASLLAALSMGVSKVALAETCDPVPNGGSFTASEFSTSCTGTFNTNINFGAPTAPPPPAVALTLQGGVSVTSSTAGAAVNVANVFGPTPPPLVNVSITANNAEITNTGFPNSSNQTGLRIQSAGSATITASGPIAVAGLNSSWGILDIAQGGEGNATVTYGQPNAPGLGITAGPLGNDGSSATSESGGINANNRGIGDAIIDASGNITAFAATGVSGLYGMIARSGDSTSTTPLTPPPLMGNAEVFYHSGTINVTGDLSRGISVTAGGDGSAIITTDPGTKIIDSAPNSAAPAVQAFAPVATAENGRTITLDVASEIMNSGPATAPGAAGPYGIRADAFVDAPISITYTGPGITTQGGNGIGIGIGTRSGGATGTGSVDVDSSGPIATNGSSAFGILAQSNGGPIAVTTSGQGTITTQGSESHGIVASSTTGSVEVTATNVSTTGEFSTGINATSIGPIASAAAASIPTSGLTQSNEDTITGVPVIRGLSAGVTGTATSPGNVTVNISPGASIMGGWQATPFSISNPTAPGTVGPLTSLPAAGVILSAAGATATLNNNGSIGALSDLAIAGDPIVNNNGTIAGFVQFAGSDNSIVNNNTFNLRHFADTNGDGVRDTVRVAVADLGPGGNNTFTNNGTLALLGAPGATTLDPTGEYLPVANTSLGNTTSNAMVFGGPVQGQLIGVATFTNSGIIDLTANPVPGDVLMITGGRGGSNPGTGGGGVFISNGGELKLDTVLNQGGAATLSDTLVVDSAELGAGGATRTFIRNAGGAGAETVGDGILVVEVLDQNHSDPGAFALGNTELRAGAFSYGLFHGGVDGSNPGDWFLRNTFEMEPPPGPGGEPPTEEVEVPPSPGPVPPGPDAPFPEDPPPSVLPPETTFPIIGPELATYGVVQPLARQLGLTQLGTLHERIGDTLTVGNGGNDAEGWARSAWGRVIGQQIDNRYQAFADPRANGQILGMQAGLDLLRASFLPGHRDVAGVYFSYLNANADVDGLVTNPAATAYVLQHTGTVNLNAYSGGAYWTHYGPGDWYLDGVLQGTGYTGDATTQFANLSTDGSGFIASLEGGYPIPIPQLGPNFILEPQAQIIWQHVSFDQANDGLGTVALGSTSGTTGRLGVRAQWTIPDANGVVWQPYGRFNVWQDWGGKSETSFSGEDVPLLNRATRLEFAGGLTYKLQPNLSFYAQAGYEFAVAPDNVQRDGVKGDIGLRYTW